MLPAVRCLRDLPGEQALAAPSAESCPSVEGLMDRSGGTIRPRGVTREDLEVASVVGQVRPKTQPPPPPPLKNPSTA